MPPADSLLTADELTQLRPLQKQSPNLDATLAEVARLRAELTLPKGSIHVISDVHGDDVKLRHVINNASGTLRPLVEKTFAGRISPFEMQDFLNLIFYPRETIERHEPDLRDAAGQRPFARRALRGLFELVRILSRR